MTQISTWRHSAGYIWALLGSAVGFANLLSFSAHCYRGGGGAFLLPYFAAMFIVGIPMLVLEAAIGQNFRSALIPACMHARGQAACFWGWLAVLSCLTIGAFYIVLTGYSLIYFFYAANGAIPSDTAHFFRYDILHISPSIHTMGTLALPLFGATCVVIITAYWVNRRPISKGIERACSFVMPLLGLFVLCAAIGVFLLPGAKEGMARLFYPRLEALRQPALWRDVFGQLFFSYSLGLGIVVGYSAHANKRVNILKAMTIVALGDFAISLLAALVIFGCIGAVSLSQNVSFESWLQTQSTFEIGFVVYPKLLQTFSALWAPGLQMLLFLCLFVAGITGVFSIIESIVGNIQWKFNLSRESSTRWVCLALAVGATPFCFGFGPHLIDTLAPQVLGINMLIGACALILIFVARKHILAPHCNFKSGRLRVYLLAVVLPWAFISMALGIYQEWIQSAGLGTAVRIGWLGLASAISLALKGSSRTAFSRHDH